MAAAAGDLTTVADVQEFLSLPVGQDAGLLQTLISNASTLIHGELNRYILQMPYTETRNGRGTYAMQTDGYPITAVSSVTIDGVSVPAATSATASGYVAGTGLIYLRGYTFSRGVQNVVLSYTAGLTAVPGDLAQACVEIVATKYNRRRDLHVSGKTLGGETISYTMADIPASAKLALANYQRVMALA
jgi:hypothetical protein